MGFAYLMFGTRILHVERLYRWRIVCKRLGRKPVSDVKMLRGAYKSDPPTLFPILDDSSNINSAWGKDVVNQIVYCILIVVNLSYKMMIIKMMIVKKKSFARPSWWLKSENVLKSSKLYKIAIHQLQYIYVYLDAMQLFV